MTREDMAARLHSLSGFAHPSEFDVLSSAAAELRKTCATCQHFSDLMDHKRRRWVECDITQTDVPVDGSGFCHRWEGKP